MQGHKDTNAIDSHLIMSNNAMEELPQPFRFPYGAEGLLFLLESVLVIYNIKIQKGDFEVIIDDPIFGELEFNYIWSKDMTIDFLGKQTEIALIVDGDEDGKFGEEQYEVYTSLMRDWDNIQHRVLQPILDYYIERRQELGYDVGFNEGYVIEVGFQDVVM
ncbi:MAG: hypothetical protein KID09_01120 [Paenibacillus macerans]|nr:hypothetical protein [Paenibacillus macerans]